MVVNKKEPQKLPTCLLILNYFSDKRIKTLRDFLGSSALDVSQLDLRLSVQGYINNQGFTSEVYFPSYFSLVYNKFTPFLCVYL